MKGRKFILTIILAGVFFILKGQDITVRAVMDTNKALIGDQMKLKLIVDQITGAYKVTFPDVNKVIQKPVEIISAQDIDSIAVENGRTKFTQEIQITVFDTGKFEISELPFIIKNEGRIDTLKSSPVSFQIEPLALDSTIRDIKAIDKMPLTAMEAVEYSMYLLLAFLLIMAVYYYTKRKKRRAVEKTIIPLNEPAHILALREIQKLADEKPWMQITQIKYYYIQLSEILRKYIEYQFHIQAFEQTTDEILSMLKKDSLLNPSEFKRLAEILKLADLVKFAKAIPEAAENALQIDRAIDFINNTAVNKAIPIVNPPEPENIITEERH